MRGIHSAAVALILTCLVAGTSWSGPLPKRVIDGEAVERSDKLHACSLPARRDYPWFLTKADCNGSFEIDAQLMAGSWRKNRPDLARPALVESRLEEYERVGLLFIWQVNGRRYGHWTGSEVPGRLPRASRRSMRYEKLFAPLVPERHYRQYLQQFNETLLVSSASASASATASAKEEEKVASLPDWIPVEAWNSWKEMRKKIRKPLTDAAERLAVKRLEKLRAEGNDPGPVLEQSVLNSWQGIFPLKTDYRDNRGQSSAGRFNPGSKHFCEEGCGAEVQAGEAYCGVCKPKVAERLRRAGVKT